MRILLLNFAYGMGVDGSKMSYLVRAPRFFYAGRSKCLELRDLVSRENADVVVLVEVDGGSVRGRFVPQWQELAAFGYSVFARSKYLPGTIWDHVPILRMHMNAIICRQGVSVSKSESLYFSVGMKRLILRQTIGSNLDIYAVHLALDYSTRKIQLIELAEIINSRGSSYETIVAGDFNSFGGRDEFNYFCKMTGLKFGSSVFLPTFPAYKPKKELDHFFVSSRIGVKSYNVLPDIISDHRAIIAEI